MKHYDIHLGDVPVGRIVQNEEGYSRFDFFERYRRLAERPVLGQHFEDDLGKSYRGKRLGLPSFFANLVPEGALRELFEHSLGVPAGDDLALLEAVGHDLPGAVTVSIADGGAEVPVEATAGEAPQVRPGSPEAEALRFSLAGVQMKFSVLTRRKRVTLPGHNQLGGWIVKLDAPRFPHLVENEYATLKWAEQAGFDVPACRLVGRDALPDLLRPHAPENSQVLLIKRYDREGGERIHQEDFAQVAGLPPKMKYKQVKYEQLSLLARAVAGKKAQTDVLRRIVFMVASANFDAHLKNWSLRYPDGIRATLAPLYDQVNIVPWKKQVDRAWALKLAGTRDPFQTRTATFERFAERTGVPPREVTKEVERTLDRIADAWHTSEASAAMPASHVEALRAYWKRVPLLEKHAVPFTS